jgi:hypothetical protein
LHEAILNRAVFLSSDIISKDDASNAICLNRYRLKSDIASTDGTLNAMQLYDIASCDVTSSDIAPRDIGLGT